MSASFDSPESTPLQRLRAVAVDVARIIAADNYLQCLNIGQLEGNCDPLSRVVGMILPVAIALVHEWRCSCQNDASWEEHSTNNNELVTITMGPHHETKPC